MGRKRRREGQPGRGLAPLALEVGHGTPVDRDGSGEALPLGSYIFVRHSRAHRRYAIIFSHRPECSRFGREKDARLAADALTRAGLVNMRRISKADPMHVLRLMIEALQW